MQFISFRDEPPSRKTTYSAVSASHPLSRGLVRMYPFANHPLDATGVRVSDISGFRGDGVLSGTGWGLGSGPLGGASLAYPGGTTAAIFSAPTAALHVSGQDFTVVGWYYPTGTTGLKWLFTNWSSGDATGPAMFTEAATVTFEVGGYANKLTTGNVLTANQWIHLAFVCSGTGATPSLSTYVNGRLNAGPTARSRVTTTAPTYLSFGSGPAGVSVDNWPGRIDAGRVYKRALTAGEIHQLYREPYAGLISGNDQLLFNSLSAAAFMARQGLTVQQAVNRASTY